MDRIGFASPMVRTVHDQGSDDKGRLKRQETNDTSRSQLHPGGENVLLLFLISFFPRTAFTKMILDSLKPQARHNQRHRAYHYSEAIRVETTHPY